MSETLTDTTDTENEKLVTKYTEEVPRSPASVEHHPNTSQPAGSMGLLWEAAGSPPWSSHSDEESSYAESAAQPTSGSMRTGPSKSHQLETGGVSMRREPSGVQRTGKESTNELSSSRDEQSEGPSQDGANSLRPSDIESDFLASATPDYQAVPSEPFDPVFDHETAGFPAASYSSGTEEGASSSTREIDDIVHKASDSHTFPQGSSHLIDDAIARLKSFSQHGSTVSVHLAGVNSPDPGLAQTSKVLKFLAPQLNQSVTQLLSEERKLSSSADKCGSKKRIDHILKKIEASREEADISLDSDESHLLDSDAKVPDKRTKKCPKLPKKRRKKKLSRAVLKKKRKELHRVIGKKLDYEDKLFDFVEPLLAREPSHLMGNRVKEYLTVAQHLPKLSFKLRQRSNYFTDLNLLDFRKYEANNQSVVDALWDALLFLKEYIDADDARIYHAEGDCIVRYKKEQCHRHPTSWPVEPGTIIAAYAAHTRETLYLQQHEFHKPAHPLGLGIPGPQPQRTVILPMLTPNNRVLAVMEFDKNHEELKEEKIHYALAYGSWVTAALIRKGIRESLRDAKEYNNTILNCLKCFLHEKLTLNQCISAIMITMRQFVKAEQVIFYHFIADKKLDADIYEATSHNRNIFTKVSKKIDLRKDYLMKDVAENHVVVNIHKNEGDQDFKKYSIFDPDINSILCVPIGNPKRLLGIVKVINKMDHPMFFDIDLVNVSNAGMYCTSIIFYTAIGKQLENTITIANKQKVTLTRHMIPCPHDIYQFRSRPITKPPPYYLSFEWYPTKEELAKDLLADYVWWMFNDLFEGDVFMDKFDVFLLMCKKGYRKTSSYHNFEHAFCATHCMFVIVRTCSQKFSYLEQMALMCAMLCHDIDHPGNTNPFLKASEHPLSKLYKFAFLENHHSNVTRILINHCKIFDHLAPDDYKAMVDDMHRLIVATDLAKHFRKKKYLDDLVKEKRFDDALPAHKMHLKSIIMTTCDLSGQFKTFERTRDITFSLYIELYREGDWLKSKGLPVHSTLDRTRYLDIPQDQVNFLSMVVIPCVHLLVQMVPVLKDPYTLANNNLDIWKRVSFSKLFH